MRAAPAEGPLVKKVGARAHMAYPVAACLSTCSPMDFCFPQGLLTRALCTLPNATNRYILSDLIRDTLDLLVAKGGRAALVAIKSYFPTYDYVVDK